MLYLQRYIVARPDPEGLTTWLGEIHDDWGGACIGLAEAQGYSEAEGTDPDAWAIHALMPTPTLVPLPDVYDPREMHSAPTE
ncbi:hypothetical protein [Nocardia sp. CC201C]|uniref:hypothetical protein n=1 Tax=Nocardia sp. CC201C TaxID=3044575 RepID=UPI0024A94E25|nr:hypothetical protein [Nocardia sp. CC201C]